MYLQLKDYDKVLNWHNLFHEDKLGQAHVRHQVTMNCIAVATHFELGNETVVESMARSCERQLSGMTIQVKIEKAFLRFLCNGLYDLPSRKEWAAFADNLITLNKRAEREDKFDFLEYFDFAEWTPQRAV